MGRKAMSGILGWEQSVLWGNQGSWPTLSTWLVRVWGGGAGWQLGAAEACGDHRVLAWAPPHPGPGWAALGLPLKGETAPV